MNKAKAVELFDFCTATSDGPYNLRRTCLQSKRGSPRWDRKEDLRLTLSRHCAVIAQPVREVEVVPGEFVKEEMSLRAALHVAPAGWRVGVPPTGSRGSKSAYPHRAARRSSTGRRLFGRNCLKHV